MSTSTEELNKKQEVSFDIADLFAFLWQKKIRIALFRKGRQVEWILTSNS